MGEKICISDLTLDALTAYIVGLGQPKFRAKQIFKWLHQKLVTEFSQMTDQPKTLLAALEEGNDIVIGSRFLTVKKPKTLRMLGSYIISWSIRLTTGRAICDPTSGMRMFNRAMVEEFAQNLNYGPEPDTISYLIKNGATVKEVQVEMGERMAGQSYLTFWRSVQYMVKMSISILLIQWFRKRDTETPYPERSL